MSALTRDRKSILLVVAAVLLVAVLARYGVFSGSDSAPTVAAVDSVPQRLPLPTRSMLLMAGRQLRLCDTLPCTIRLPIASSWAKTSPRRPSS